MSDIQRYIVERDNLLSDLHEFNCQDDVYVVKYDDHIADKADLKAENFLLRNELADAQDRIAELEKECYEMYLDKELHHDLIKAQGIEEMMQNIQTDGYISASLHDEFLEYADKLRTKQ